MPHAPNPAEQLETAAQSMTLAEDRLYRAERETEAAMQNLEDTVKAYDAAVIAHRLWEQRVEQ